MKRTGSSMALAPLGAASSGPHPPLPASGGGMGGGPRSGCGRCPSLNPNGLKSHWAEILVARRVQQVGGEPSCLKLIIAEETEMPRSRSTAIQSERTRRRSPRALTSPASVNAPLHIHITFPPITIYPRQTAAISRSTSSCWRPDARSGCSSVGFSFCRATGRRGQAIPRYRRRRAYDGRAPSCQWSGWL